MTVTQGRARQGLFGSIVRRQVFGMFSMDLHVGDWKQRQFDANGLPIDDTRVDHNGLKHEHEHRRPIAASADAQPLKAKERSIAITDSLRCASTLQQPRHACTPVTVTVAMGSATPLWICPESLGCADAIDVRYAALHLGTVVP